jgi:hypothetical protein
MPDGSNKDNKVSGLSFDFGTLFYPGWKSFRFGMSVRNFGAEFEYEKESFELPLTFSLGIGMNVLDIFDMENQTLLLTVDAIHPRDYTERVNIGAEYILMDLIALRGGYKTNHDNEGFTAGIGIYYEVSGFNLKFDYAYADQQYVDGINRFSLGFSF